MWSHRFTPTGAPRSIICIPNTNSTLIAVVVIGAMIGTLIIFVGLRRVAKHLFSSEDGDYEEVQDDDEINSLRNDLNNYGATS